MARSLAYIAVLAVLLSGTPVSAALAQGRGEHIRFTTGEGPALQRWAGELTAIGADSIFVRVSRADTVAAFARVSVHSLMRSRRATPAGKAAAVGCLLLGTPLGALGYFGTHDPDSPGLEKAAGVVGFAVGCGVGGIIGLVVSALNRDVWEPWSLPDA